MFGPPPSFIIRLVILLHVLIGRGTQLCLVSCHHLSVHTRFGHTRARGSRELNHVNREQYFHPYLHAATLIHTCSDSVVSAVVSFMFRKWRQV